MEEKANAWGNSQDRGALHSAARFASERKQEQTSSESYTKLIMTGEIEPNGKFDIELQLNKWTGGTANRLEPN